MFNKLRNKFLVLNMSVTSGVIAAAFIFVYFITYSNLQSDIRNRLQAHPDQVRVESENPDKQGLQSGRQSTVGHIVADGVNVFQIEVDADGNIININSVVNMSEKTYRQFVEIAWSKRDANDVISLNGRQWRYGISPIRIQTVGENGIPVAVDQKNYSITFLDVTEINRTLLQLLTTLLIVGFATLIIIFAVSFCFANRAIKPIRESWDKQKQFVADASHELKTPLSIIHANCDALMANKDDTIQNQMKWINYIRIGTDRMAKLVNGLLTLARTEAPPKPLRSESFVVGDIVNNVIRSMEPAAADKSIDLACSIAPDIISNGYPDCVRQLVEILLENAIKYTDSAGWIELSLVKTNRHIEFSITNSGAGIARKDLPKVFERFFRGDRSRIHEDGSYGLGLAIAKSIIEQLGGEIKVTSVENESTTFSFTISQ
ncbi:sensor histidine kinase [Paenibacillus allorhizosphaerae]|nr:HAMP domain-containing sensor histidine kinase [Paenibacillus allorhizosphaerae]